MFNRVSSERLGVAGPELDGLFATLPALMRCALIPGARVENVRQFMEMLLAVDSALFSGAVLFSSRNGRPFVCVAENIASEATRHHWARWPLDRLFTIRRSCLITNPVDGTRALAVPFATSSQDRYVVVAILRSTIVTPAQKAFLDAMQSFVIVATQQAEYWQGTGLNDVRLDLAGDPPSLVLFGEDGYIRTYVRELAERRGWPIRVAPTFGHVLRSVAEGAIDIVLLDRRFLNDPLSKLRALRHVVTADVLVLYLDDAEANSELEALVDERIAPSVGTNELFQALKRLIRLVPLRRAKVLEALVFREQARIDMCTDRDELAPAIANAALAIYGDVAAVTLVDEAGRLFSAESPARGKPLVTGVPATFLNGYATIRSRLDESFFADLFDDEATRKRLLQMNWTSGASIPIIAFERIAGTLFVLSSTHALTRAHASALNALSESAGSAFENLSESGTWQMGGDISSRWRDIEVGEVHIHVYCGPGAVSCAVTKAVDPRCALLALADAGNFDSSREICEQVIEELAALRADAEARQALEFVVTSFKTRAGVLAAIVDGRGAVEYAAADSPAPLQIPAHGPLALPLERRTSHHGTVTLKPDSATLFYDSRFSEIVDSARMVDAVQYYLQRESLNPSVSLPEVAVDRDSLTFVEITKRSADVAQPHPSDFA
jgi:hypothetical protein